MTSPQKPPESVTLQPAVSTMPQQPRSESAIDVLGQSLRFGARAGLCGLLFGATAGILRGAPPTYFALISGTQWFTLTSFYWGTRSIALARHGSTSQATPSQKVDASFISGASTGALAGALYRGPGNILPAALVFSLAGAGSQALLNKVDSSAASSSESKKDVWYLLEWVGLRKIPNQEYHEVLKEEILKVDASIALVKEDVARLQALKAQAEAQRAAEKLSDNLESTSSEPTKPQ